MTPTLSADIPAYYQRLVRETGCLGYLFTPTPLRIRKDLLDRLNTAVPALLDLLRKPEYFERCIEQENWILPVRVMQPTDYTGCADFLLTEDGAKLIEMNINLPGKVGLMQTLGETARTCLGDPGADWANGDFNRRLIDTIGHALPGDGPIAIVVSHLISSAMHLAHYRYFSDELNAAGLETAIVHANRMTATAEGLVCDGIVYQRVINLVIPFVWENNPTEFAELTSFWKQHPDRLFPNPTGGMFGTKDLLSWLDSCRGESNAHSWTDFVLRAHMLSEFADEDALLREYEPSKMVLKPLKDYDTRGVYVRPDLWEIREAFESTEKRYMVQEFTDSLTVPFTLPDGREVISHSVIFRIFFASGKPFGYQGYFIHGAFNGEYYTAPVIMEN